MSTHSVWGSLSVVSPTSFENVRQKWATEVRKYHKAPILLVGTQTDLRENASVRERLSKASYNFQRSDRSGRTDYDRRKLFATAAAFLFDASLECLSLRTSASVSVPSFLSIFPSLSIQLQNKQAPVTREQGERLAKDIRAFKYMECSAMTQEGLKGRRGSAYRLRPRRGSRSPSHSQRKDNGRGRGGGAGSVAREGKHISETCLNCSRVRRGDSGVARPAGNGGRNCRKAVRDRLPSHVIR